MKQFFSLVVALIFCGLHTPSIASAISLEDIVNNQYKAQAPYHMQPLPDGEHYTVLSEDSSSIYKCSYKTGKMVEVLLDLKKARETKINKMEGYLINSTGFRILVWNNTEPIYRRSWKADFYDYDVRRNLIKPLSDQTGKLMLPSLSPDGRMCAFVRDNNIWLKKFDYDTESAVTKDGSIHKILNGLSDWVYEEEFSVTNRMAWSPDSKILAFVKSDESEVSDFSFQTYHQALYPGFYQYKYPKAGSNNSRQAVHAYSVETKDIKPLKLPIEADAYIPRIVFTNNPDQLAVMCLNRQQNAFSMYYANPKSTVSKLILKEESDTYIDSNWLNSIHFTDNHFTYVSESDGFAHIHLYGITGILQKKITSGNWDVTDFLGINPVDNTVYYQSAEESPLRRDIYKIDAKGKKTKLSPRNGFNTAVFSADFRYVVNCHSTATSPDTYSVYDTNSGKELFVLEDNASLKKRLAQVQAGKKEFFTIMTPEGYELNAWMIKPTDFNPSRRYPVLMMPYNGPDSQEVLDKYEIGWEYFLASQQYIVVSVDGRGTGARGTAFRKCTYMKLGILESDDQIAAARHLATLPYIDSKQISIWGWSYGGTVSLLALNRGDGLFKSAIAIAPVTDWRFYNTIYTERFMRTPNENKKGYDESSVFSYIPGMKGRLMLIHGTADDNVHLQNTLYYTEALVEAGKQFDMQVYTNKNHSILGPKNRLHLFQTCYRFITSN